MNKSAANVTNAITTVTQHASSIITTYHTAWANATTGFPKMNIFIIFHVLAMNNIELDPYVGKFCPWYWWFPGRKPSIADKNSRYKWKEESLPREQVCAAKYHGSNLIKQHENLVKEKWLIGIGKKQTNKNEKQNKTKNKKQNKTKQK